MSMAVTGIPLWSNSVAAAGRATSTASSQAAAASTADAAAAPPDDGGNFSAMSPADMRTKANALYKSGTISLAELGQLTLMPAKAVKGWDGGVRFEPTGVSGDAAADEPHDYISEIQGHIDFLQQSGDTNGTVAGWQTLLHKLKHLDQAQNPVGATA
jgi:hypothetical protein